MLSRIFGKRPPKTVRLSGTDTAFEVGRNQTILEAALQQGLDYPHDCTVGTCGTCRSRLLSGKVDAITPFGYTLSAQELKEGYILACQAVPESDVEVAVDLAPDLPATRSAARISGLEDLTHDIKRVTWQVDTPVHYLAGQYMKVSWPGGAAPRSYSFSRAPDRNGTAELSSFIRRVQGGAFTDALFEGQFTKSTEFTIDAPHGNFWLREGSGPILLVGGGSGLSPLMSLLEDALGRGVRRNCILLFGARGQRDLYCISDIERIANDWPADFAFRPVLSEETVADMRHGMVTGEIAPAVSDLGGTDSLQAYMCGPPPMIDAGVEKLSALGVPLSSIHYDKFTDASTSAAVR